MRVPRLFVPAAAGFALIGASPLNEGGVGKGGVGEGVGADGGQITTMTFHQRIVIRVPRLGDAPPPPAMAPPIWVEKKGPRCVAAATLAGAMVPAPQVIDLVLIGNRRIRAHLEGGCDQLDFYSGFYLRPAADGRICAGRDSIRTRAGTSCPIERFRTLKAKTPRR